jgi:hypothetical protein
VAPEKNIVYSGGKPVITPSAGRPLFYESGQEVGVRKGFSLFRFCDFEGRICQRRVVVDAQGNPVGYVSLLFGERPHGAVH